MKVVCAVDGSEFSRWGVEALEALAAQEPESVTLLHVVDVPSTTKARRKTLTVEKRAHSAMEQAGDQILQRMERVSAVALGQAATGPHTKIQRAVVHGPVARTIATYAKRHRADLIIIGSRGASDIRGFLLGSVSRRVAAIAPCPVLVVKKPLTTLSSVLLAVDDSKHSKGAARFLSTRFLPSSAQVTILSVVEPAVTELAAQFLPASQLEELLEPKRNNALQLVTQMRDQFLKEGYAVTTTVQTDHPTETIMSSAAGHQTDLLVVGSRGLSGSERLQLGSVAETVLKYAPCSVLVVRGWRA